MVSFCKVQLILTNLHDLVVQSIVSLAKGLLCRNCHFYFNTVNFFLCRRLEESCVFSQISFVKCVICSLASMDGENSG